MKATCTECQEVKFIQNKTHVMCGECVYKKNHNGKSKEEVYSEKAYKKQLDRAVKNTVKIVLDKIEGQLIWTNSKNAPPSYGGEEVLSTRDYDLFVHEIEESAKPNKAFKSAAKKYLKKSKPKQVSNKQKEINKEYKATCIDMDHMTEPFCTGCAMYQGGDVKLSHSHIISREDCKRIGRIDLIFDRNNLTYHCMDFGHNKGCHGIWENPKKRSSLLDYDKNINYIKSIDNSLYLKYTKDVE